MDVIKPVILSNFLKFSSMWSHSMTTQLLEFGAAIATKMSSLKEKMSADMDWMGMDWWRKKSVRCRQKQKLLVCWLSENRNLHTRSFSYISVLWEASFVFILYVFYQSFAVTIRFWTTLSNCCVDCCEIWNRHLALSFILMSANINVLWVFLFVFLQRLCSMRGYVDVFRRKHVSKPWICFFLRAND